MAGKTQNPAPVMDAPIQTPEVKRGPGRPKGSSNNGNATAESSARTKAIKAAKQAVKDLGPAGPTADVQISRSENASVTGWGLAMGEPIKFGSETWIVSVNGEALGTFT